jgi:hypothetical protein
MKKIITNYCTDIFMFVVLMSQVFTGILLHRFPPELTDATILGLTRYTWGTIHWSVSILFALITITHLILHWGWVKATTLRYVRMKSKVLLASMTIFFLIVFLTPYYITRDFPNRQDIMNYTQTSLQGVAIQDEGLNVIGP